MVEPTDFQKFRTERDIDPEFIRKDDMGRPMYSFLLSYKFAGSTWGGVSIWAYSFEDAQERAKAMRESLEVLGQIGGVIPG
ncbi:hypothetical protein [Rhizobium phage RHEph18]|uniref:hypothetical protein n=1 Tax=Rhizobium TaxID=379 RepID=UPI0007EB9FD5|nr:MULTISPECIES: hypothetical protein [Rhizobium]ANL02683.1 hypothetical protein AMJ99_CH01096 [Rhizobium esperanzae]ANM33535.1 hypothetical protein AMK04_CH01097 [Rhizobium sp. N871]QIG73768.1 hypothetical protein EVC05_076 [Rhizobium phage RHph_N2]QXV74486.1 hypothetical protein [Rhizobium phage RHEph18]